MGIWNKRQLTWVLIMANLILALFLIGSWGLAPDESTLYDTTTWRQTIGVIAILSIMPIFVNSIIFVVYKIE